PPWTFETHVADLIETIDSLDLAQPDWVGHSFGGRLLLELAARHPDRMRRAALLDPAIHLLPHVAEWAASTELEPPEWASVEAWLAARGSCRCRACTWSCGPPSTRPQLPSNSSSQRILAPRADAISSTASLPVAFSRSSTGFTSTTSNELAFADSATTSIARCASR